MKNKLLAGCLFFLIGILLASCAGNNNDAAFDKVKERLQLTDVQVPLVKPIFDEQMAKAAQIIKEAKEQKKEGSFDYSRVAWSSREATAGSSETAAGSGEAGVNPLFVKLEALKAETQQELIPILSAQQIDEYNKMADEEIAKLRQAQNNQGGSGRKRGGRRRGGFSGGLGMPGGGF